MRNRERLAEAIAFASQAHMRQFRWEGQPYITHPMRVTQELENDGEEEGILIVAVLHDVLEDCPWIQVGRVPGVPNEVLLDDVQGGQQFILTNEEYEALDAMTRRKDQGEEYPEYIRRLAQNPWAVKIKIADINDNLPTMRPGSPSHNKHRDAQASLESL